VLGASSGIGREIALQFAGRGAKVVVAARSEPGLDSLVREITERGGEAVAVTCEVTNVLDVDRVADTAVQTFGRIDTWINVAAISVYASFEETKLDEFWRVMDVNFLGQVYGARAALPHLRQQGRGALIAVSSVEAEVSLPLHSAYAASKHAVEGAFDALRRELQAEGASISVTSIKPATINTPFFNNALSKLGVKPKGPPPIYEPAVVAACALYAAEHPVREVFAGGAGRLMVLQQRLSPRVMDALLSRVGIPLQRTGEPRAPEDNALREPRAGDNRVDGDFSSQARGFSLYTALETRPALKRLIAGSVLAGTALWRQRRARAAS
jgi:NAD(P)-dependent dehydrogenase (short-subunit alcohol dehydrogenase family)